MRDAAAGIANNDHVGDVRRPDRQMLVRSEATYTGEPRPS